MRQSQSDQVDPRGQYTASSDPPPPICKLLLHLLLRITTITNHKEQTERGAAAFTCLNCSEVFLCSLLCLVIKANTATSVVSEDKLPGERRGLDVKRIKFENKTHLEKRNELPSTTGQGKVEFASSN